MEEIEVESILKKAILNIRNFKMDMLLLDEILDPIEDVKLLQVREDAIGYAEELLKKLRIKLCEIRGE